MKNSLLFVFSLPLWLVGNVVAWPALVLAERANFEPGLIASLGLQHGVGHWGRGRAAELTQGLREGPQAILQTGKSVARA